MADTSGPASYTFSVDDVGETITFACGIGNHCESGQIISFQVEAITSAPTMTPTAASTLLPAADFKAGIDNGECKPMADASFLKGVSISIHFPLSQTI